MSSNTPGLLKVGDSLPEFSVAVTGSQTLQKQDFIGQYTVLYFYPKDSTPGCTTEGLDFTALHSEFKKLNTQIFGASMDSMRRHDNFKTKQDFSFELISDPESEFCQLFGVYQLKKNFGKEYMGIVRTTYVINPEGEIIAVWPKVKVKGHAQEVLDFIKQTVDA